ncbi:hypothetical protein [Psittacicella gerlachiana]|uniref:Uncharacterized protein n=1 Tax=Psittacicella gerlachiana TaxID=2028574 RepID=A0A3A1YFL1_9GAMM|nr:hypothetical protein [Psittacicella gerlachiana]RIY36465.1 hypothetical protein CKF59_02640 [Psittacicella gerlachiana]
MKKLKFLGALLLLSSSVLAVKAEPIDLYGYNHGSYEYLGCLNCNQYSADSIWNSQGKYGSRYSRDSVFYFGLSWNTNQYISKNLFPSLSGNDPSMFAKCNDQSPVIAGRNTKIIYGYLCRGGKLDGMVDLFEYMIDNGKTFDDLSPEVQREIKKVFQY